MTGIEAVLLDMDGVVIDSEPIHERAQRIVFETYDLEVPESEFPSFKGMTERRVFERVLARYGSPEHDIDELVEAKETTFRRLLVDLELVPGVLEFIRSVKDRYRLALTTSSVRKNQRAAFDKFDLSPFFEAVVTAEDITHPKPHPEPYLVTAAHLGVKPEACLVVEDSVHGVRAGLAAGCRVVGITTSFDAGRLQEAGAHHVVDSFAQLTRKLSSHSRSSQILPIS